MSDIDLTSLITGKNMVLGGGCFALTTTIRASFKEFFKGHVGERILPWIPVLLGIIGALGGVCEGVGPWQDRLILGAVVGFSAGHIFKLGKTSIMGIGVPERKGKDDKDDDEADEGSSPPPAGGGESGNK